MKKIIYLLSAVVFITALSKKTSAQTMLMWEKSYGGSDFEQPFGSEPTADGGIILGGHSISNDGDITSNVGDYDWWVFKVNAAGNIVWQKSYGGSQYDKCRYATENPDGTSLAFGSVKSNDFDVTGNHSDSINDFWLLKLDADGDIIWSRCYGGTQEEGGRSVIRTHDGSYVIAGYTHSSDGDITDHIGGYDVWIAKVDSGNGDIIWAKSYGGTKIERVRSIYQWPNGDFVFTGNTDSENFDLAGTINNGDEDVYVSRIDSSGNVVWAVQYGGPGKDRAYYCTRDADGNVLVAGKDSANGGNVTGNQGESDVWVLKLNYTDGTIIWQKSFGGTDDDEGFRIDPTQDGGYIIGATTHSNDGDVPSFRGYADYWFIKIDANLNIQWTRTDGGPSYDHLNDLIIKDDGSYVGIGFSSSDAGPNSEITGNHGSYDEWLVQFTYCDSMAAIIPGGAVTVCSNENIVLTAPLAESYVWSNGETTASISVNSGGVYTVDITRANGACVRTSLPTTVTVLPAPAVPLVSVSNDSLLCTASATTYQWYYNGNAIPGETGNYLLNADSCGNYYVEVTDVNGCSAVSASLFCPLSVNYFGDAQNNYEVFPNPSKDFVLLSADMKQGVNAQLIIYSAAGSKVMTQALDLKAGNNKNELNIKQLTHGIYVLELKDENTTLVRRRFIKE